MRTAAFIFFDYLLPLVAIACSCIALLADGCN